MNDTITEDFVKKQVAGMDGFLNWITGTDKVAAEQLVDYINSPQLNTVQREDAIRKTNEAHLPGLELFGAEDTDSNGIADKVTGVKLGGRVLYDSSAKK